MRIFEPILALLLLTGCSAARAPEPVVTGAAPAKAAPSAATTAENGLPGTADWKIGRRGGEHEIEGFADRVSVPPGADFRLFVSTTRPSWHVEAFRIGWYGGKRARLLWTSPAQTGTRQAAARIDPATLTVTAPWKPSLTVPTRGWPAGSYLLRLTASSGAQRYVPITVRSPDAAGRLVVLNATTTWQAYNGWGGHDLYGGPTGFDSRSRAVSFDRPYDLDGAEKFRVHELDAIVLAEKQGLPLAYATDNDLHRDGGLLHGARGLITLGHDEYWSTAMWRRTEQARDRGVNLAFLGANAVNRHIRFAPTRLGEDRLVICYKSADDPIGRTDPGETTVDWRIGTPPRPESALIGIQYNCFPADGAYVVRRPGNWLFAGTGATKGKAYPGLMGPETDGLNRSGPIPRPIEVLSHSPIRCGSGSATHADSTYYTTKSGAGVFASGGMRFTCALRGPRCGHGVTWESRAFVAGVIANLLKGFAAGPAGFAHPAEDDLDSVSGF